jgi:hypothetical protein
MCLKNVCVCVFQVHTTFLLMLISFAPSSLHPVHVGVLE